jgi:hypothetical protein
MDSSFVMMTGFALAAYSVVANDVIQTLGTFLSSNSRRPWWVLWLYASSILLLVVLYGWYTHGGDVSYGRLAKVPFPTNYAWWYILPPAVLLIITRFGYPVSTTFMIITIFSLGSTITEQTTVSQMIAGIFDPNALIGKMIMKSLSGYLLALVLAFLVYVIISKSIESFFINTYKGDPPSTYWVMAQWLSTGFLWSMWLIQDMANIFAYLPRKLSFSQLSGALITILTLQAITFYSKGGAIQRVVTTKTNIGDIRSATIIDFIYGLILLFFKEYNNVPMSTTWVFVGLLAGRELGIVFSISQRPLHEVRRMMTQDLFKVFLGLLVSILLVLLIVQLN